MPRLVRIIFNPVSGAAKRHALLRRLRDGILRRGWQLDLRPTRRPGDAAAFAAAQPHADALVVIGGDGTVREAASGLITTRSRLLVAPAGTENLVARHFGFRADAEQLLAALDADRTTTADVAAANGQPFLCIAGFGFDAEVVQRLTAARRGHITHADYFWPIWRAFWSHRWPVMHVEADGEPVHDGPAMVFVANIPRYALGLRLTPRARADDGLLDLCVYRCASIPTLLRHTVNTILVRQLDTPGVFYRQARRIRVSAQRPVAVQLDGDPAVPLTPDRAVEFTISPHALSVCAPATA